MDDEENNNYIRENIINALIEKKIVGELLIDQFGNYGNYILNKFLKIILNSNLNFIDITKFLFQIK